jgi:phage portal protein BeeE
LAIQHSSRAFFANNAIPGGILTAPGKIGEETARRLKESWQENYSGRNSGRVAVLGDDLKFQQMSVPAEDAQLVEQLKLTAEMVCACFHLPAYKIGVGQMPTVNNTAALNQQYMDQCLHPLFESAEARLDHGLELPGLMEFWFDTANLLRLDPESRFKSHSEAIKGGWMTPNEARQAEDMEPVEGGDSPYMQQQNFSLAALARRDENEGAPDSITARQNSLSYFGTWRAGEYQRGAAVTRSGSLWIAERATDRRPGDAGSGWKLAVKNGDAGRLEGRQCALSISWNRSGRLRATVASSPASRWMTWVTS